MTIGGRGGQTFSMPNHWWSERDPKLRDAAKAAATPREDNIARRRYIETKRQRIERLRPKGATDRVLNTIQQIEAT
jgi:hypothetical protein